MDRRSAPTVGLLSITVIGFELVWTRLFSAEFFYTFAFLALSLAVLGLGLGALSLRFVPRLTGAGALGWMLAATGGAALTAVLVAPLGFFIGMPFPTAALRVGALVDWGFAGRAGSRPAAPGGVRSGPPSRPGRTSRR